MSLVAPTADVPAGEFGGSRIGESRAGPAEFGISAPVDFESPGLEGRPARMLLCGLLQLTVVGLLADLVGAELRRLSPLTRMGPAVAWFDCCRMDCSAPMLPGVLPAACITGNKHHEHDLPTVIACTTKTPPSITNLKEMHDVLICLCPKPSGRTPPWLRPRL